MSNKHIRSMEMREAVDGKTMAKGIGNVRKWNKFGLLTTAPSLCSFYSILFAIIWCKYVDFCVRKTPELPLSPDRVLGSQDQRIQWIFRFSERFFFSSFGAWFVFFSFFALILLFFKRRHLVLVFSSLHFRFALWNRKFFYGNTNTWILAKVKNDSMNEWMNSTTLMIFYHFHTIFCVEGPNTMSDALLMYDMGEPSARIIVYCKQLCLKTKHAAESEESDGELEWATEREGERRKATQHTHCAPAEFVRRRFFKLHSIPNENGTL